MDSIFPDLPNDDDVPKNFQELWNSLAGRNKQKYEYLRAHQLKILEELSEKMKNSKIKDYAISLPTGTGKTLIGLLLLRYLMLREKLTAMYLCPNIFLCKQILKDARDLDIPAVPLYGKWSEIPTNYKNNFLSGDSIGIATYSTLFNSYPRVGKVGLIVMDDVHAAGDSIISNWSLKIERDINAELFDQVYEKIKPVLNRSQRNAIDSKPNINEQYEMLYSRQWLPVIDDLIPILDAHSRDNDIKYQWETARNKLENYFCILHRNSIEIRSLTPPSHTLHQFNEAKYRFYMSATLDNTGNLENNIGIEKLEWISLNDIDVPGNRLMLNLDLLMPKNTDENKVISIVQKVNKTIILTQSIAHQSILKSALKDVGYKGRVFTPNSENICGDMDKFKNSQKAVLLLAGRYDGIDLGNGIADGIIMYHLPQAINSFESFTTLKWETNDESVARAIQRVHQGMGRCTRRDSDQVMIFFIGDDLIKIIQNPQTILSFPGKLRKELELCQQIKDQAKLDAYINAVIEQTDAWKKLKENIIREAAKLNSGELKTINNTEHFVFSKYSNYLWNGNYTAAQDLATTIMGKLNDEGKEKDSAIWAYLGGVSSDISSFINGKDPSLETGNRLFEQAVSRANNREWFGSLSNFLHSTELKDAVEMDRVKIIYRNLSNFPVEQNKFKEYIEGLIKKVEDNEVKNNEDKNIKQFLKEFGTLLGYDTLVPSRPGAPDCIWSLNGTAAYIFEAKTNKKNDIINISEVRQIISMPEEIKSNEKLVVPDNLLPICITDAHEIAREDADLGEKFYVLRTAELKELAKNWLYRLLAIQNRAFKEENYLKSQIEHALITQGLTKQDLQVKLYKSKGNEVLKPQKPL